MRKQYNVNQFEKRKPNRGEILRAKALARKVSAKLLALMEARKVTD